MHTGLKKVGCIQHDICVIGYEVTPGHAMWQCQHVHLLDGYFKLSINESFKTRFSSCHEQHCLEVAG